jgi:hypothetical protein
MVSGAWWSPEALLGERRGDRLLLREKGGNEKKKKKSMNQLKVGIFDLMGVGVARS